ncbi:hypothetical protein COV22_04280, partial [Candidatus Woesearchaeota archaeon CG10_big_fil_rev_8_21_14_0_10_47_5]
ASCMRIECEANPEKTPHKQYGEEHPPKDKNSMPVLPAYAAAEPGMKPSVITHINGVYAGG